MIGESSSEEQLEEKKTMCKHRTPKTIISNGSLMATYTRGLQLLGSKKTGRCHSKRTRDSVARNARKLRRGNWRIKHVVQC